MAWGNLSNCLCCVQEESFWNIPFHPHSPLIASYHSTERHTKKSIGRRQRGIYISIFHLRRVGRRWCYFWNENKLHQLSSTVSWSLERWRVCHLMCLDVYPFKENSGSRLTRSSIAAACGTESAESGPDSFALRASGWEAACNWGSSKIRLDFSAVDIWSMLWMKQILLQRPLAGHLRVHHKPEWDWLTAETHSDSAVNATDPHQSSVTCKCDKCNRLENRHKESI